MTAVLVIAARELREKTRFLVVAGALALIPFAVAFAPGAGANREMAIMTVGATLALVYALALAVGIGATTIGRDLTENRLSFYLSKPVSASAVWIGKSGAAFLTILAGLAIIALPSMAAAYRPWWSLWVTNSASIVFEPLVLIVASFLVSHVASTMLRSRSVLLALDFVMVVITVVFLALLAQPLILGSAMGMLTLLLLVFGAALLSALAIAPIWQIARGRTDLRRSHVALSRFLWVTTAILLSFAAAYVRWVVNVNPTKLVEVGAQQSSAGWTVVEGYGEHRGDYRALFLVNASTQKFERLPSAWGNYAWSRDGRVVAWMQPATFIPETFVPSLEQMVGELPRELYTREVGSSRTVATGIIRRDWAPFVLSDDGSRVAIVGERGLVVHDLGSHRVLAAVAGISRSVNLFFVTPDLVRIVERRYEGNDLETLSVADLDVRTRRLVRHGSRVMPSAQGRVSTSADGSRMFLHSTGEIVDGRTLASVATIGPARPSSWRSKMLADGRVAFIDESSGVRLRMFDRDGRPQGLVDLPKASNALVAGETMDGKVILHGWVGIYANRSSVTSYLVDVAQQRIERVVPGSVNPAFLWIDPRLPRLDAAQPIVGVDPKGKLNFWRQQS